MRPNPTRIADKRDLLAWVEQRAHASLDPEERQAVCDAITSLDHPQWGAGWDAFLDGLPPFTRLLAGTALGRAASAAASLNAALGGLTDAQRVTVFNAVRAGYCEHCGGPSGAAGDCHCTNDE